MLVLVAKTKKLDSSLFQNKKINEHGYRCFQDSLERDRIKTLNNTWFKNLSGINLDEANLNQSRSRGTETGMTTICPLGIAHSPIPSFTSYACVNSFLGCVYVEEIASALRQLIDLISTWFTSFRPNKGTSVYKDSSVS